MNDYYPSDLIEQPVISQIPQMSIPSFDLLGVRLHTMTRHDLVQTVVHAMDDRRQCIIGNHNLHSLYLWSHEPKMREFYSSADYINIDGMSLVLLGRLLGRPFTSEYRTNYIDFLPLFAEEATKRQWRVFYLGSRPDVAEKAVATLRTRYSGLQIAAHSGYFDTLQSGAQNQSVLAEIREYAPDVLMVGMGMPRQEIWIQENLNDITATAVFCCGGLMDLVAGAIPTPPRWVGPLGIEWLFRLFSQPARTWRRYLLEPWLLLFEVVKEYLESGRLCIQANGAACSEDKESVPYDHAKN